MLLLILGDSLLSSVVGLGIEYPQSGMKNGFTAADVV